MPRCGPSSSRRFVSRCFPAVRCWATARSGARKRDADKAATVVPALPEPVPTHRFEIDATTDIVGVVQKTNATKEDTLTDIARRFNVGYEEIVRANPGVDPWLPGENREIVIPSQFILPNAPREGIVINAAAMRLFYYPKVKKGEHAGRAHLSHRHRQGGLEDARRRDQDRAPHEGSGVAPDSVDHQGAHEERGEKLRPSCRRARTIRSAAIAFYLGWPTYMIHGTNKPAGVGLRSSHGCIRLYPEDIAQLFELAPIGTQRARRESAVRVRLARRRAAHPGLRRARRRSARLEKGAGQAAQQGDGRAHPEGARGAQGKDRLGGGVEARARAARHSRVGDRRPGSARSRSSPRATIVQNKVAPGATWDGISDLPVDEATFQELVSDRESSVESAAAAAAPARPTHRSPSPTELMGTFR